MNRSLSVFTPALTFMLLVLWISLGIQIVRAGEAKLAWRVDWEATLRTAEAEGQVTVYVQSDYARTVDHFQSVYPKVKLVTSVGARGIDIAQRIMAERRSGKYLADVYIAGVGTQTQVLYPAKALAPMRPALMLPEVKDESKWSGGSHHYLYPEEGYAFVFDKYVSHWINFNTTLVKADEIKSWWDLINPSWKGKLVGYDPTIPGVGTPALWFFYKNPALGPKFIQELYGTMEVTISRDRRQLPDWLATGKAALCIACPGETRKLKAQGLPVDVVTHSMQEGDFIAFGNGIVSLVNPTPHPSAAKVFLNWLLSREGQMKFQEMTAKSGNARNSARMDIPKDTVDVNEIPKPGIKYMQEGRGTEDERIEAIRLFQKFMRK